MHLKGSSQQGWRTGFQRLHGNNVPQQLLFEVSSSFSALAKAWFQPVIAHAAGCSQWGNVKKL